jgi:hypothetical protein
LIHLQGLDRLKEVSFYEVPLGDEGLRHLAALPNLEKLELTYTQVSDVGTTHLAALLHLRTLSLSGTEVTDKGLPNLATLKWLEDLHVGPHVTEDGAARLKEALPNCRIFGYTQAGNHKFFIQQ